MSDAEPLFETVAPTAVGAHLFVGQDGRVEHVDHQAARLFGRAPEELVGLDLDDLLLTGADDVRREVGSVAASATRIRSVLDVTLKGPHQSTTARTGDQAPNGVEVEAILTRAAADDRTLVSLLLRARAAPHRYPGLFRDVLETAPDAMVIIDERGQVVLVNGQVETSFGVPRDQLVGQPVQVLVPGRFIDLYADYLQAYFQMPHTQPTVLSGELFARRADGSEFPVEISLAPLATGTGLVVSAAIRDISERRRLEVEAGRMQDEFLATVSHELRTPLTSIIGYGELMADLEDLSSQGARFLSVMMRSAERELRLVDDLLTLVAIEESGLAIEAVELNLHKVVQHAVEAARPRAEEAEMDLVLDVQCPGVVVRGDADRLGQAVDNLLSNAIKFTPRQGSIRVVLRQYQGVAEIDVIDSGPGIGASAPHQIFQRLFRDPSAIERQIPGAGLGLPIARAIVEAHHGTIGVVESQEVGTTFRITLPIDAASPPEVPIPTLD